MRLLVLSLSAVLFAMSGIPAWANIVCDDAMLFQSPKPLSTEDLNSQIETLAQAVQKELQLADGQPATEDHFANHPQFVPAATGSMFARLLHPASKDALPWPQVEKLIRSGVLENSDSSWTDQGFVSSVMIGLGVLKGDIPSFIKNMSILKTALPQESRETQARLALLLEASAVQGRRIPVEKLIQVHERAMGLLGILSHKLSNAQRSAEKLGPIAQASVDAALETLQKNGVKSLFPTALNIAVVKLAVFEAGKLEDIVARLEQLVQDSFAEENLHAEQVATLFEASYRKGADSSGIKQRLAGLNALYEQTFGTSLETNWSASPINGILSRLVAFEGMEPVQAIEIIKDAYAHAPVVPFHARAAAEKIYARSFASPKEGGAQSPQTPARFSMSEDQAVALIKKIHSRPVVSPEEAMAFVKTASPQATIQPAQAVELIKEVYRSSSSADDETLRLILASHSMNRSTIAESMVELPR